VGHAEEPREAAGVGALAHPGGSTPGRPTARMND
jgi:hypothetical protein